jgi:hypothetical protein
LLACPSFASLFASNKISASIALGDFFHQQGLAIKGSDVLFEQWSATFTTFLSNALADKGYTFELVPLDFSTTYTAVENQEVDFVHTNPSIFSCLEMEHGAHAITTQNNFRLGKELFSFGGSVIARRDRDDISTLDDIRGRVVEAVSLSGLGACQMQWRELQSHGLEFLTDPKEVRFAYNQKNIVKDGAWVPWPPSSLKPSFKSFPFHHFIPPPPCLKLRVRVPNCVSMLELDVSAA